MEAGCPKGSGRGGDGLGYDAHITRARGRAGQEALPITEAEWRALVAADPELELTGRAEASTPDGVLRYESPGLAAWRRHPGGDSVWFDFRLGTIIVKNPDDATLAKMISLAQKLRARVEGDDGEVYQAPGAPPRPPTPGLGQRLASALDRFRPRRGPEAKVLPFQVGDRVRDAWGRRGTVLVIDLAAQQGLGAVRTRFDDGRELTSAAVAHGLIPVSEE